MFKNKILKKIGAGLMAGLCAFTLIGTNIGGLKTSAATTAKEPLLSGDEVIKQAAKYLGVPYGWDCKGYDGCVTAQDKSFFRFTVNFFIRLDRKILCGV